MIVQAADYTQLPQQLALLGPIGMRRVNHSDVGRLLGLYFLHDLIDRSEVYEPHRGVTEYHTDVLMHRIGPLPYTIVYDDMGSRWTVALIYHNSTNYPEESFNIPSL